MSETLEHPVVVLESGYGPYAQFVTVGRHVMGADESERLGGQDSGPSPYEYVMAGLGACTAMTLRMYANRRAWKIRTIAVEVKHERVETPAGKTDRFKRLIRIDGDLTHEQRARLLEIAEKCPVSRTLQRPSLVTSRFADAVAALEPA
jgi:putative redox protein